MAPAASVAERIEQLEDDVRGQDGLNVQIARMDVKLDAHEKKDEDRHNDIKSMLGQMAAATEAQNQRMWKLMLILVALAASAAGLGSALPNVLKIVNP